MGSDNWPRASRSTSTIVSLLWACLALASPQLASADATAAEREMARSAMQMGDQLQSKGDLRGALQQYRSAHAIMHVPTTGLAVARTEAELQLLVEARSSAMEVINLPGADQESAVLAEARVAAGELAAKLEPLVPSIVVDVSPSQSAYTVKLDGNPLPAAARYLTLKANPGRHTIEVTAPGYSGHVQEVSVLESETILLAVTLDPLPVLHTPSVPTISPQLAAKHTAMPERDQTLDSMHSAGRTRGLVSLTAGGVLLLGGAAAGIASFVKTARIEPRCDDGYCGESRRSALATANTLANVANVAVPLGLLGIAYAMYELLSADEPLQTARKNDSGSLFVRLPAVGVRW